MINTYFDRVDAASGYKPTRSSPIEDDPRYYGGSLYATMLDRNVAQAKNYLANFIDYQARIAKLEIQGKFKRVEGSEG